ncbi:MAG TPA: MG2 domain-containing protein [Candidatus Saccharimonadales bacterium]|nr:MG2 domain-containing protein [Candidatus Saccharimonadales bacterium]
MVPKQTQSTIVLILAVLIGLSIAQTSGILVSPVAANSLSFQPLTLKTAGDVTPILNVGPSSQTVQAGALAQYQISVSQGEATKVFLVSRGVPSQSVAIFTPESGLADPSFNSSLAIVTSTNSLAGTYDITIVGVADGQELTREISLQITSTAPQTNSSVNTIPTLSLKVEADQSDYKPNDTMNVRGYVMDSSGNAVDGTAISLQVDGPTGSEMVFITNITTDSAGFFQAPLRIPANATAGAYTVFAAASKPGYNSATTHTSFVIDNSLTPSVTILQLYATDATGNPSAVFSNSQTILFWVVLQNTGASIQGMIWIQILDPKGTLVSIQLQISTLATGATVKVAFGFTPSSTSLEGIYSANALVSDKLISQGGTFLANANAQFVLTE